MNTELHKILKKTKGIITRNTLFKYMIIGGIIGSTLGAVVSILALFLPIYNDVIYSIILLIVGFAGGIIFGVIKRPSMIKAAKSLDKLGLSERIITAYENRAEEDAFSIVQREDALRLVQQINIKKSFKIGIKWRTYVGIVLAIVVIVVTAYIPNNSKELAKEKHDLKEAIEAETDKVEDVIDEVEAMDNLSEEEKKALTEALEEAIKELEEGTSKEELAKASERAALKLNQEANNAENKEAKITLESLAKELTNESINEDLADMEKLQEELESLSESKEGLSSLSEEEKENLSEALKKAAKSIGDENLSKTADKVSEGSATNEDMAKASKSVKNAANKDNNSDSAQTGEGNESANQAGEGNQKGTGTGKGNNSSGDQAGGGWNTGDKNGEEDNSTGTSDMITVPIIEGEDENLTGTGNDNNTGNTSKSNNGLAWSGKKADYNQVIGDYTNSANSKIEKSTYPNGLKSTIKNYFNELNK